MRTLLHSLALKSHEAGKRGCRQSCLTTQAHAHEALAKVRALSEDVKLLLELITLASVLLRFASDTLHGVVAHGEDVGRKENFGQGGDQLGLDELDRNVVHETLQGDLKQTLVSVPVGACGL